MNRKIPLVFSALLFGGIFAADMTGNYNTWLGYIAGINADGERSTMQGAGAGGEATGIIRTDYVGAAAGAYSSNMVDCVGMGYRALRGASDMSEVVAIGAGALTNRTGLTKATWVNGQFAAFAQNNSFWVKANPATADTNAPIHYANGVLSLNADEVRINGETTSGGGTGGTSAPVLAGFDLYVDPVNGDDDFAGKTPGTAKRTIDGAFAAITNHGAAICLLPGVHASPSGNFSAVDQYPAFRVYLYGAYGPSQTAIDGEGARCFTGCNYPFTVIEGCTVRGLVPIANNQPLIFATYLYNCRIEVAGFNPLIRGPYFAYCVFEKTKVVGAAAMSNAFQSPQNSAIFNRCDVFDTVVDLTTTNDTTVCPSLSLSSYFENSFVNIRGPVYRFNASAGESVLGNASGMNESTFICPRAVYSFEVPTALGSLFGLGDITNSVPVYGTTTGSVCTNATTVAGIIGSDYRPPVSEWRFRFAGYGSAAERATKNAMENSIIDALLKNEDLNISGTTGGAMLMGIVLQNEEVDAPRTVNRSTNAAPESVSFPPEI